MELCNLCPRNCQVARPQAENGTGTTGFCQMPLTPKVARAGLHFWEEPCLSGTKGSGTVFFSGCNLHCVFCQNYDISTLNKGKEVSIARLREIYHKLIQEGAHNINLVTPTHYLKTVAASLDEPLAVPVVYNTGSYEKVEALELLRGKVQIYLPDLKYYSTSLAQRYSKAADYFTVAARAIKEMYRQVGPYELDDRGLMRKGVIIRHLILPGQVEDTKKLIDWVSATFQPGQVLFSLMQQYVPCGNAADFPEINRKVTKAEYEEAADYLLASTIEDGFMQEEGAAEEKFIPAFDGSGV